MSRFIKVSSNCRKNWLGRCARPLLNTDVGWVDRLRRKRKKGTKKERNPTLLEHLRGRAISPKAPRPQTRAATGPDGPRDSSPTGEVAAGPWGPLAEEPGRDHRSGSSSSVALTNSHQVWWAPHAFGLMWRTEETLALVLKKRSEIPAKPRIPKRKISVDFGT